MVENVTRYVFAPASESPPSCSSFSEWKENPKYILGLDTRSSFNENSLKEILKENNLREIFFQPPL